MTIKISGEGKKAAGKDNMASSGREKKNSGNGILSKIRKKISRNKSQEKPELDYNATQDKDTNRTLILSHSSDHDIVTGLKEALERADEVKLKRMEDIRAESSKPNTDEDTNNLIEEMKSLNGVLVLCTEKMVELLNDNNTKETKELEVQIVFLRYILTNSAYKPPLYLFNDTKFLLSLLLRAHSVGAKKFRRESASRSGQNRASFKNFSLMGESIDRSKKHFPMERKQKMT
eukprot:Seg6271.3 transcript_id=Seg6271.3/GoldUCD/mRNA.D3Y31 product="hypothetical protein" protein_id=Seg6271.3/GoldUCD/D3Y31